MREWYFVFHLEQDEDGRDVYEVQVLDDDGKAISVVVFHDPTEIGGRIPLAVAIAAMERPIGPGDYVDADGAIVPPF